MNTRSLMVALLSLGFAPLLGACTAEVEVRTPVEYIAMESDGTAVLPPGSASGRSPGLKLGGREGFWIGRSEAGEYYVRTTTNKRKHRFQGRIRALDGELTNVRPTRLDFNDRFKLEGRDIVFDITTQSEADGFEFGVSKNACVEFDLRIDGKKQAPYITLGEKEQHTPSSHFSVCP